MLFCGSCPNYNVKISVISIGDKDKGADNVTKVCYLCLSI